VQAHEAGAYPAHPSGLIAAEAGIDVPRRGRNADILTEHGPGRSWRQREIVIELISYSNAVVALLLALYAIAISGRTGTPGRWGAAAFAALAAVLVVATFDPGVEGAIVAKVVIGLLLAFPYCLLRFAVSFGRGPLDGCGPPVCWPQPC
jgi:hypothetical protein